MPTSAIADLIESPEPLAAWLEGRPPLAVVGDAYTPDDSLLANFIWASLGVYVDAADFVFDGESFIEIPDWYRRFLQVESQRIKARGTQRIEWTASEALDMLHTALGEG